MKKNIIAILVFILFASLYVLCEAQEEDKLSAGIFYNEKSARKEAFKNTAKQSETYNQDSDKFYLDLNDKSKIQAIGQNDINLFKFAHLKCYNVIFKDDLEREFIYIEVNDKTKLAAYIIKDLSDDYPKKYLKYDTKGNLVSVELAISENESYVFNKNAKLIAHWKDKKGKAIKKPVSIEQNLLYFNED